jgi:hypothetical protein
MLLCYELTEGGSDVTLVRELVDLSVRVKSLLCLSDVIKLSVKRRQTGLFAVILLGESELCTESELL